MNKFAYLFSLCLFLSTLFLSGQAGSFSFALITDTHIGSGSADEDLRRTVEDINDIDSVVFVIVAGDVTEFGSDAELLLAKKILGTSSPATMTPNGLRAVPTVSASSLVTRHLSSTTADGSL